jgi:outer membrane protein assembly factor BamB
VAGPVVAPDGIAYLAANDGILHAIDVSSGRDRWTFNGSAHYGGDLSTGALILADGDVLWPGPRHRLYALTPQGRLRWTLTATADVLTPVLDPRGDLLIVADMSGRIAAYQLHRDGSVPQKVWSRRLASGSYGSPAVAADGTIYETSGNCLFALAPSGHVKWTVTTPDQVEVSPAVATNGIVVFGSDNRLEYGVNPNGRVRWTEKIGNYTYSSPLAIPGRRVLFGNHSGAMTILNSDTGQGIRRDRTSGQLWTAATVDSRDDVYFASRLGHIVGFTATGRSLFDRRTGTRFDSYPTLAPDGTLLIGAVDGTLYALRSPKPHPVRPGADR